MTDTRHDPRYLELPRVLIDESSNSGRCIVCERAVGDAHALHCATGQAQSAAPPVQAMTRDAGGCPLCDATYPHEHDFGPPVPTAPQLRQYKRTERDESVRPWSCWRCCSVHEIRGPEDRGQGCGACDWTGIDLQRYIRERARLAAPQAEDVIERAANALDDACILLDRMPQRSLVVHHREKMARNRDALLALLASQAPKGGE